MLCFAEFSDALVHGAWYSAYSLKTLLEKDYIYT